MQPSGLQTTCPFCGKTVSSALRFCPQCGKPLAQRPACPSCGIELVTGRQFCSGCGRKIPLPEKDPGRPPIPAPDQAGVPARNAAPAITTGLQGSGPVNPPARGGSGLIKIALIAGVVIVLGMILLIVIGLIFMVIPTGDPGRAGSATAGSLAPADIRPTAQDIQARETARSAAVTALGKGDEQGFITLLTDADQEKYRSGTGLGRAGMNTLATALSTAKVTDETTRTALYETEIGGTDLSFMAVKEGETWKLAGI